MRRTPFINLRPRRKVLGIKKQAFAIFIELFELKPQSRNDSDDFSEFQNSLDWFIKYLEPSHFVPNHRHSSVFPFSWIFIQPSDNQELNSYAHVLIQAQTFFIKFNFLKTSSISRWIKVKINSDFSIFLNTLLKFRFWPVQIKARLKSSSGTGLSGTIQVTVSTRKWISWLISWLNHPTAEKTPLSTYSMWHTTVCDILLFLIDRFSRIRDRKQYTWCVIFWSLVK